MNSGHDEDKTLLHHYGEPIARYAGIGNLLVELGHEIPCEFEMGQFADVENILLCTFSQHYVVDAHYHGDSAMSFVGETSEGYKVTAEEGFFGINYLPDMQVREGEYVAAFNAYSFCKGRIEAPHPGVRKRLHFGLTNLVFHSYEKPWSDDSYVITVPVGDPHRPVSFSVRLLPNYERISTALLTLKQAHRRRLVGHLCCSSPFPHAARSQ